MSNDYKDKNLWLMQGDCLERMKEIPDGSVDLILTDVPYKVITGGRKDGAKSKRPAGILTDNTELMKNIPKFDDWLPECYRVLKDGTHAYFMVNYNNLVELHQSVEKCGFKVHNLLVWQKNNNTPSQYYMKNCEYIIFARKGKAKWINDIGGSKTVHTFKNIIGNKNHPTEKPVELMEFYILNSTDENDTVLDPFMGSGATGVASLNANRKFIGIEIVDNYYDIAKDRILGTPLPDNIQEDGF